MVSPFICQNEEYTWVWCIPFASLVSTACPRGRLSLQTLASGQQLSPWFRFCDVAKPWSLRASVSSLVNWGRKSSRPVVRMKWQCHCASCLVDVIKCLVKKWPNTEPPVKMTRHYFTEHRIWGRTRRQFCVTLNPPRESNFSFNFLLIPLILWN